MWAFSPLTFFCSFNLFALLKKINLVRNSLFQLWVFDSLENNRLIFILLIAIHFRKNQFIEFQIYFFFSHKFHRFYVVKNYFSNDFSFNTDCTTFKCALFVYVYAVCYYFMDSKKISSFKYVGCNTYEKIRNHYIQCACLPEIEYGKLIRSGEHEQQQEGSQIDSKNVMENMKQFHLSVKHRNIVCNKAIIWIIFRFRIIPFSVSFQASNTLLEKRISEYWNK